MDPQQRTCHLPFLNRVAFTEPLRRAFVLAVACDVVICRRIRRRLPFSEALTQLPPCEYVRYLTIDNDRIDDERFMSSTLSTVVCMINFASVAAAFPS